MKSGNWNPAVLSPPALQACAEVIFQMGSPLQSCFLLTEQYGLLRDLIIIGEFSTTVIKGACEFNYFLLIAKLYIWDCRRFQILPSLAGFKINIKIKIETENISALRTKL